MLINHSIRLGSTKTHFSVWRLLDWIYPPVCCGCGKIGFEICPDCFSRIDLLESVRTCQCCGKAIKRNSLCRECASEPPSFTQLKSWGVYSDVLQKIVTRIKYKRGFGLVEYLTQPLVDMIANWKISVDMLVPVPLGQQRLRSRGYNQTALFAKPLAQKLHIPYYPQALTRIKETQSQVGLHAAERRKNLAGAFRANQDCCKDKTVLLVDDIATTGSTLNECSNALEQAGANKIYCFTVARTTNLSNLKKQEMEVIT